MKEQLFPRHLFIGKHRYKVKQPRILYRYGCMGEVRYQDKEIEVATHSSRTGRKFSASQAQDTFWHEVTHAILYEMGHKYYKDERFVTHFAHYLNRAIRTARF